jgi:hypothetical protein
MITGLEVLGGDQDSARNSITALGAIFSLAAVVLGVVNFRRARKLDKRDLFLRMHETMIQPDAVAGRRALYKITSPKDAETSCMNDVTSSQIYRALALFDVLALYVESGWIDEGTVLKEWSNSLARSQEPARLWIAARYKGVHWHSWPHYQSLAKMAARVEKGRAELGGMHKSNPMT